MTERLDGKVALVTGSGRGIGREIARALASHGAHVVVVDNGSDVDGSGKRSDVAEAAAAAIRDGGGKATGRSADVADTQAVEALVDELVDFCGPIDVLVNAAGNYRLGTISTVTDDAWDSVMRVHLRGTMVMTRAVVRQLLERNAPGRVLNFTSLAGTAGLPNQLAYATAKAGIVGFTRAVANEVRHRGISVNAISPGYATRMAFRGLQRETLDSLAQTDAAPAKLADPALDPAHIGPLIVYLASDADISITGRVFGAGGTKYSRLGTIDEQCSIVSPQGWTVDMLDALFPTTLGTGFDVRLPYALETLDLAGEQELTAELVERRYPGR